MGVIVWGWWLLAQAEAPLGPTPTSGDRSPGRHFDDLLVVAGVGLGLGLGLGLVLFVWAKYFRRPGRRQSSSSSSQASSRSAVASVPEDGEEDGAVEAGGGEERSRRRRKRRPRREHRPRNPTLSETGGLPPKRTGDAAGPTL
jgi:hypothetical protein